MSSANCTGFRTLDNFTISFILYIIKSNGPNIDPCGTPHLICIKSESLVYNDTY